MKELEQRMNEGVTLKAELIASYPQSLGQELTLAIPDKTSYD